MIRTGVFLLACMMLTPCVSEAEEITLFKHARRAEPTEFTRYTVQPGDTLWKIMVQTQNARYNHFPYLYKKFRELNPGVADPDHIITGQKLLIPHIPGSAGEFSVRAASEDVYVIKRGQHLAMILREVYGIPDDLIFNEYLNLIKKLNPEIEDLNLVEAGQRIRMPEISQAKGSAESEAGARKPETKEAGGEGKRPDQLLHELIEQKVHELTQQQKAAEQEVDQERAAPVLQEERDSEARLSAASILEISRKKRQATPEVKSQEVPPPVVQAAPPIEKASKERQDGLRDDKPEIASKKQPKPSGQRDRVPERRAGKKVDGPRSGGLPGVKEDPARPGSQEGAGKGESREDGDSKESTVTRIVRNTLLPALTRMGGSQKDQGTYFMPMSGGSSVSIDTSEIPVIELDTGMRIILDMDSRISPEVKDILEKAFPSCKIISGPVQGLESLMDRVLSVSGYFSVNKDASPLLVGEEEKIRFYGKWIVYKDFSRQNVFVINILSNEESQTPEPIRSYASRFGIDLVEMGGKQWASPEVSGGALVELGRSYRELFDLLGLPCEQDKNLELVTLDALSISYKAPLKYKNFILADEPPDETMTEILTKRGYTVVDTRTESLESVLGILGVELEGPPIKTVVAQNRTELELPAVQVGEVVILSGPLDRDIARYLASAGMKIAVW